MSHLRHIRSELTKNLWAIYQNDVKHAAIIARAMKAYSASPIALDHYAIIDLPSAKTGLSTLCQIFSAIGYTAQGRDYLAEKQNEFLWMAECDAINKPVDQVLPQVVIADFRLDDLPVEIRKIIEKYTRHITATPLSKIQNLSGQAFLGNRDAADQLIKILIDYFMVRDTPLPTVTDFKQVHEYNELLAWVLVFGRQPNHFTISVHLLENFASLHEFNRFIEKLPLPLNDRGGVIKGSHDQGIEQSATQGELITIALADGTTTLPERFIEFTWRYPIKNPTTNMKWNDYFTGFIAHNANRIIESVFVSQGERP